MKMRTGFVSNSSSSSFVCMTTKENSDMVLAGFKPEQRDAFDLFASFCLTERTFMGKPMVVLAYASGNAGDYLYDELRGNVDEFVEKYPEHEDNPWDVIWDAVNKWEKRVALDKEVTFTHAEDM